MRNSFGYRSGKFRLGVFGVEPLVICDEYEYSVGGGPLTEGYLQLLEAVSDRASKANCFEFDINRSNKTIGIRFLSGNRVIHTLNSVSSSYTVDGHTHYNEEYKTQSKINLCVIDPSQQIYTQLEETQ